MEWSTACVDWERRIVARESLIVAPPLFAVQADEAWEVFGGLVLVDVAGQPTMREACLPWVKDWVRAIFGAYDAEAGRRLINEFFFMVSKKNMKSTAAAGIMLTALVLNWRPSAELLILSPTKEIADNSYKPIRDMIKADDDLAAMLKVQDYFRTITHRDNAATLKVVAADSDTVSGKKASFVFVDELHEFGKQAKASNMLLEATGGLTSRPDGFVIYATTQSAEPPAGVFKDKLSYARKVRDGFIKDPRFLPMIYEFPESMLSDGAHKDLANAYVTNPNWGASVDIARITQLHSQALEGGEKDFKEFLAKHLNVEIGMNLRSDRWAGADFWEAAKAAHPVTLESLLEWSEVLDVGIDGGGLDDLLGLCVIGRHKVTRQWLIWTHAWAHPSVLERRKEIAPRLLDFAKQGDLTLVSNIGDDVFEVAEIIARCEASGLLDKVGCDPAGLGGILDALVEADVPQEKVIGISQGWRMTGAIKTTERKLAEGVLVHGGQLLMAWCVGNAKVELRSNAIVITKQASGTAKIDPLMAVFNAVTLMSLNPEAQGPSVYETRGIRFL
ncbi:terminase [Variovorax boronicumulans]|uniref:Terminase n=1 Tax=Variovorax boronicumulans TaxID=436515 RepID=A0A250DLH1_9BURK|nr:terminase large subunit [Variovorax boronicumulans]ATA55180.1 terminase [Variovorax boronicumulans]